MLLVFENRLVTCTGAYCVLFGKFCLELGLALLSDVDCLLGLSSFLSNSLCGAGFRIPFIFWWGCWGSIWIPSSSMLGASWACPGRICDFRDSRTWLANCLIFGLTPMFMSELSNSSSAGYWIELAVSVKCGLDMICVGWPLCVPHWVYDGALCCGRSLGLPRLGYSALVPIDPSVLVRPPPELPFYCAYLVRIDRKSFLS